MIINRENYELYAIDYIDGTLAPDEKQMLEQFLYENQDIRQELEGLGMVVLVPDEKTLFEGKAGLMKPEKQALFGWAISALLLLLLLSAVSLWYQNVGREVAKGQAIAPKKEVAESPKAEGKTIKTQERMPALEIKTSGEDNGEKIPATSHKPGNSKQEADKNDLSGKKQNNPAPETSEMPVKHRTEKTDSLEIKMQKPLVQPIPMAIVVPDKLPFQNEEADLEGLAEIKQQEIHNTLAFSKIKTKQESKSFKTPFGKIQFSDIAQAFLPESYIAGK